MSNQMIAITEEQFERLLRRGDPQGLGAPDDTPARRVLGLGTQTLGRPAGLGSNPMELEDGVWALLAAGSPRLAYARAIGCPFQPFFVNVRATFGSTDTTDILDIGSDIKIVQDTLVDCLVVSIRNQSATANLSIFQPQSDWYFKQQSGFEAKLQVQGGPRYSVAEKFTPLETLGDTFVGDSKWPGRPWLWILTYQNQLFMDFHATVTLPYAPIEVVCTFRTYNAIGPRWMAMTNDEAYTGLADCGIVVSDAYKKQWGR